MLIMNRVTPLWAVDYFVAFVWTEGIRVLVSIFFEYFQTGEYRANPYSRLHCKLLSCPWRY